MYFLLEKGKFHCHVSLLEGILLGDRSPLYVFKILLHIILSYMHTTQAKK